MRLYQRRPQWKMSLSQKEATMTLKDKRIIVLGGTSGIGLAVAEAAATDGAQVLVASSDDARVKRALTMLPATRKDTRSTCRAPPPSRLSSTLSGLMTISSTPRGSR